MKIKFPRASLRARIIAWSFVPTTIILLAVALVTFYAYQRVTEDLVVGRNQQVTRLSAGQLAADLGNYTDSLTTLARTADISQGDPARQSAALEQAASRLAVFDGGMLVLNHLGQVVATDPGRSALLGQDWSTRAFFREIIHNTGPTFSDILPGNPEIIAVAVPILSEQGESRGSLVGMFHLDASTVSAFYAGLVKLRLSDNGSTFLVDSVGRVIYHPDPSRIGGDLHQQAVVQQVLKRQAGYLRTRDLDQRDILATFAPVPGTPWGLVNEEDWSSLLASGRSYEQFLIMLLALGVVVPTLVVAFGVKRITDPVAKLIVAAKEIAGGKFGRQIAVRTGDELEELVKQFNLMSSELADSYAALKEREERLALVIEGTNDGIWDWNLESDEVYFSPRWKAMLGYEDSEVANRFDVWLELMHPDDRDQVEAELQAYLKGQTPIYQVEHRLRHKDGSYRWILARGIALRRADGKPYRMAGSHTDITVRKRADEAVRQSEKRFSQVFHASPVPIVITALADGRYVEVNDAWLRLMGYTRAEVMGTTSLELNVWAEPEQRVEMLQELRATGSVR
ncbi:MAG TPA: PAS domain S-box protein, partial [Candidatus Binataceae bacterium]|nr:PAS domain S-box protein [Candidatus Binataceae bacterium]